MTISRRGPTNWADGGALEHRSADWKNPSAQEIADAVIAHSRPGGIVLMHDGGGDRSSTVAALPTILSTLGDQGYVFEVMPVPDRSRHDRHRRPVVAKRQAPPGRCLFSTAAATYTGLAAASPAAVGSDVRA
jgi:hypothetical protein